MKSTQTVLLIAALGSGFIGILSGNVALVVLALVFCVVGFLL